MAPGASKEGSAVDGAITTPKSTVVRVENRARRHSTTQGWLLKCRPALHAALVYVEVLIIGEHNPYLSLEADSTSFIGCQPSLRGVVGAGERWRPSWCFGW